MNPISEVEFIRNASKFKPVWSDDLNTSTFREDSYLTWYQGTRVHNMQRIHGESFFVKSPTVFK